MQSVLEEIKDELRDTVQKRQRGDRDTLRRLALQQAKQESFSAKDKALLVEVLERIGRDLGWFSKLVKVAMQKLEVDHWRTTGGSADTQAKLDQRRNDVIRERNELRARVRALEIEEQNISAKQRSAGAMHGDVRVFEMLNPVMFSADDVQPREFDRIPLTLDEARQARTTPPGTLWSEPRGAF